MPDAQPPPDAEDGNGDQPRRSGLKLRDAETVAATRRDMFGDGSLLDTLAGSPPASEEAGADPEGLADAGPPATAAAEPGDESSPPDTSVPAPPPSADAAAGTEPGAPDASGRDEASTPQPDDEAPSRFANPASSPFAQVPQSLDSIIDSFAAEPSSNHTAGAEAEPADFVPPHPTGFGRVPPGGAPGAMAVSSIFDRLGPGEPPAEEELPASATPPFGASSPDIPMPVVPSQDGQPDAAWTEHEPAPALSEVPPETEDGADGPEVAAEAAGVPFPAEPADPPPFPEPSEEGAGLPRYAEPPALRPFPESIESPSTPGSLDPPEASNVLQYPGAGTRSPFDLPDEDAGRPMPDAAAQIAAEATATAEALDHLKRLLAQNAPGGSVPGADGPIQPGDFDSAPRRTAGASYNLRVDAAPFVFDGRTPLLPLPMPPERTRVKRIYLLGFLTGLALSLMAGIALYVLITMG
jgi:hypothetical protein